jgi:hypothetical protein
MNGRNFRPSSDPFSGLTDAVAMRHFGMFLDE